MAESAESVYTVPPVCVGNWDSKGTYPDGTEFQIMDYRGADDDKSSIIGVTPGSTYFAWDSSKFYMYDGTRWNELFASGD